MALILSLQLDAASQDDFNRLRVQYFPPALNRIAAHVTLFHHLPDAHLGAIAGELNARPSAHAPIPIETRGLRNLGRGVAFHLKSPPLITLRNGLAKTWWDWLTPQDRQKYRPHITVQNKVSPELARVTLAELQKHPLPAPALGVGLQLWTYLDGPWQHLQTFPFGS